MPYRFAIANKDYSDYANGRVFYAAPGHPAFPVRLISEVFQRCQAVRSENGVIDPAVIYDPCCGGAYHLSALAYLHWSEIQAMIGSDIDLEVLTTAERNLSLLTQSGLGQRRQEIEKMHTEFGKNSHLSALKSVQYFSQLAEENQLIHPIDTHLFQADGLNQEEVMRNIAGRQIDIVLADVPYGEMSNWNTTQSKSEPLTDLLESLLAVVSPQTVVAIMTNKAQKCSHARYNRVGRFQIGKRRIFLLKPIA